MYSIVLCTYSDQRYRNFDVLIFGIHSGFGPGRISKVNRTVQKPREIGVLRVSSFTDVKSLNEIWDRVGLEGEHDWGLVLFYLGSWGVLGVLR